MADNVETSAGSGGATFAADDIGGVMFARTKVVIGVDGSNDGDVSSANPMPVKGTGTAGTANAGVLTVQGIASMTPVQVGDNSGSLTVDAPVGTPVFVRLSDGSSAISTLPVSAASLPLPTGAATAAKQPALGTAGTASADVITVQGIASMTALKVDGSAVTQPVSDAGGSLTVDNGGTFAVQAELESSSMRAGGTAVTPKFAVIDAATSGDNTLVAAVASKKIRVLALMVVAAGAVNARFESGAGGTALSGQMNLTTNSGFTLPFNPLGWFETGSNTLLNLELSAAVSVDGMLVYVEV